jgi:hypothetical protein
MGVIQRLQYITPIGANDDDFSDVILIVANILFKIITNKGKI